MKKSNIIFLSILAVLFISLAAGYIYITSSSTTKAYLNVESGEVMVDSGNGFILVEDGVKLKANNIVKTNADSEASIIFYESVVLSLDPNTEVLVESLAKDNLKVKQNSGSTWTKFMTILGVMGMSIETPGTVATVRGTNFGVDMDFVYVDEGLVNVRSELGEEEIGAGENALYEEGKLTKGNLTEQQKQRIIEFKKRQIKILEEIRMNEILKKRIIIERLLKSNNLGLEDLPIYLNDLDSGEDDLDELADALPIKLDSAEKIIDLTEKIREEKNRIKDLESINLE